MFYEEIKNSRRELSCLISKERWFYRVLFSSSLFWQFLWQVYTSQWISWLPSRCMQHSNTKVRIDSAFVCYCMWMHTENAEHAIVLNTIATAGVVSGICFPLLFDNIMNKDNGQFCVFAVDLIWEFVRNAKAVFVDIFHSPLSVLFLRLFVRLLVYLCICFYSFTCTWTTSACHI